MSSEFWSAIVGSLVGGAIVLGIQGLTFADARSERKRQRDEVTAATAYALFLKLQSCWNATLSDRPSRYNLTASCDPTDSTVCFASSMSHN